MNFAGNLTSAFAIGRVVTLSVAENYFDPGAFGTIDFLWRKPEVMVAEFKL